MKKQSHTQSYHTFHLLLQLLCYVLLLLLNKLLLCFDCLILIQFILDVRGHFQIQKYILHLHFKNLKICKAIDCQKVRIQNDRDLGVCLQLFWSESGKGSPKCL